MGPGPFRIASTSFSKGGARVVAVAPPGRMVEVNDAVAAVRRDGGVERDRSDRSPVGELAALLQRVQLAAVRHARVRRFDAEGQLALLQGVGVAELPQDLVAEIVV